MSGVKEEGQWLYEYYRRKSQANRLVPWEDIEKAEEKGFWAALEDGAEGRIHEAFLAERSYICEFMTAMAGAIVTLKAEDVPTPISPQLKEISGRLVQATLEEMARRIRAGDHIKRVPDRETIKN